MTVNREIIRLAIPNIISNVSVPLLSTVDTILMGQLSALHLGAVGLGSMIFNFIYWNFGFLRMGTTGITAQAFGAENSKAIRNTLVRSLAIALLISSILILAQGPLGRMSAQVMQVDGSQLDMVLTYFNVRIWAAPASLGIYVMMGWFFGMQNAIYPLVVTILINVVNIVLSYLFIIHMGMEISGVAWSTVIAQYLGLFTCFLLLAKKYPEHTAGWSRKAFENLEELKRFFQINSDLFIRTVCLTFAFGFFYSQSSAAGETILAINVILLQMVNWASYGIDGFAYAAESLVGKYFGKKDPSNVRKSINLSLWWGFALAALFTLVYGVFAQEITNLFSTDLAVNAASVEFVWYAILFPLVGFLCYIWDGIYIGLTASKAMRNTMLISLAFYLLFYYGLRDQAPNHFLWIAMLAFILFRGVIQSLWYRYSLAKSMKAAFLREDTLQGQGSGRPFFTDDTIEVKDNRRS